MMEMTSAEFTRANLSTLTEPVVIKRYTKIIGTYFPEGMEPTGSEVSPSIGQPRVIVDDEPELDMVTMFRYIAAELRDIRMDLPCSDPLFHDHK